MGQDPRFSDITAAFASGRFKTARERLNSQRHELQRADGLLFAALLSDVDLQSGDLEEAQRSAQRLLRETDSVNIRATAYRILAEASANQLQFEDSLKHYGAARSLCRTGVSSGLRASVELSFWGWFAGVLPLETSQAEFASVRKAVAASSHPHHVAELRLCAGRVEARKGSLMEARRHWELAQRLIKDKSNLKLEAQLRLDGCMLALLSGDMRTALDFAKRAAAVGEESGYFRASVAALVNQAHVLHALGQLDSARQIAESAVSRCGDHRQLRVAALDCLANILVASKDFDGADAAFEEITHLRPKHGTRLAPHWDVLSELSSRVSLAKLRERPADRDAFIALGLKTAQESLDKTWLTRMQLELAESCLRAGNMDSAVDPLASAASAVDPSPELVARTAAMKALASLKAGDIAGAASSYGRGTRIAAAIENSALAADLQNECSRLEGKPTLHSLDDSVALIELAGYPHVLGREAYALLELSGAAEAPGAHCPGRRRRCAAWPRGDGPRPRPSTPPAEPGERLRIACGIHRDETWEIVADLRPTLNDRCTGVAIRKLVDTAVTIDRYRREEKQRAALWPADTLETDGGLWVSEQMTELLSIAKRIAPVRHHRPAHRRDRHRQGSARARHPPRLGPRRQAVRPLQLHRGAARDAREPAVRLPQGGLHRRRQRLRRRHPRRRRRHAVPRRDRRDRPGAPAQAAALPRDPRSPRPRRGAAGQGRRPGHRRHQRRPRNAWSPTAASARTSSTASTSSACGCRRCASAARRSRRSIDHYLRKFADEQKKGRLALDDETLEYLVLYAWPGNVRQLVNEVSRIVAFADPDSTDHAGAAVAGDPGVAPHRAGAAGRRAGDPHPPRSAAQRRRRGDRTGHGHCARSIAPRGNYENAAKLLGISRKGLFLKRRRWGMQRAS